MRILLTGSSGWLGRFLAPMLREAGHEVVGMDVAPGRETQVVASVADKARVRGVFATHAIEAVIHAGGLHKPDIARFSTQAFIDTNVTGTLNLLEAARDAGHDRFVFTSTTSLMITEAIRGEEGAHAIWLDEDFAPLAPRNIYGATKLAAEHLCRLGAGKDGLSCVVLRTSRFFPEEDDTLRGLSGENLKANEFLNRRLTVQDAARAHLVALDKAPDIGFGVFIASAPTPFRLEDAAALKRDARGVILDLYPEAEELYARKGWSLPASVSRVYDAGRAERMLGWRAQTDFAAILAALRAGEPMPFAHDPDFVSPVLTAQPC
jgi:UDP-glucose 4-epimerase